ncbi:MAG: Multidrug resistance transporter, superfamily protein [Pseudonocardiales bacterium]|nr:Multidrug resistance transporter, superfamily protein [Pseudonocardiales bacterium]
MYAVLAMSVVTYSLVQSLAQPILPVIQREMHTDQATVTWIVTAYLLSASVATPIVGRLGDAYGKEKMMVACLAALGVGSVIAGLAPSIGIMIAARVIQGIGGGVLPLAFGVIRDEFPTEKVPGAVGFVSSLLAVAGGLGLTLSGPIVSHFGFRWVYWFPAIMSVIAVSLVRRFVPASPVRREGRVNWAAAALLTLWLVALLLGVSKAPTWGWISTSVIGLFVVAIVVAVIWVVVESRSDSPLIDMQMMRLPAVWTLNLTGLLFGMAIYTISAFMPVFLQTPSSTGYGFGESVTRSGLIILPLTLTMFVAGTSSGWLANRYGSRLVLIIGSWISVIPFVSLVFLHSSVWTVVIAEALMGVGVGLAFSAMGALIVDSVDPDQTGVASGMNANIRTIGGAVGAAIVGSVLASHSQVDGLPKEVGYTIGFSIVAGATVLAAFAALLVPRLTRRTDPHSVQQRELLHPQNALFAGATIVGDEPE